jgi:hypothetical protein
MKSEAGEGSNKLNAMVDYYTKDLSTLSEIGKTYRGKWKVKDNVSQMHDLSKLEARNFENLINERIKKMGLIDNDDGSGT